MSEQQKEKPINEQRAIAEWEVLFPTPMEAVQYKKIADQLIASGLGKRAKEKDVEFLLRIQYCIAKDIPLCFINSTYILEGKVSEMVDLKMWRFKRAYPDAEFVVKACNEKMMIKVGRIDPSHNWVQVKWDIEKAKELRLYSDEKNQWGHYKKAQWALNTQSMLNARCNGQLVDILGGLESQGSGYLSVDEINATGIDMEAQK